MTLLNHALAESEPDPGTAVDSGGFVYLVETGEVVGHVDAHELFRVSSREDAEWALELRCRIEAEILAVDARREALLRNLDAQRRAAVRRLSWWEWRFGPDLIGWAKRQLEGGRGRTLTLAWGRVRGRQTPGAHAVLDDREALAFVRAWRPDLVVVRESVGVRAVLAARREAEAAAGEAVDLPWLVASPPGESWAVETGIEQLKKGDEP